MSIIHIKSKNDFTDFVLKADKPVLVDFWATWCGPCKMVAPEVEALANDYDGKAVIAKVDVDEVGELANELSIMGVPTMIIFKNGEEADRVVGYRPRRELGIALDKVL
jgi:thioredoxin 1